MRRGRFGSLIVPCVAVATFVACGSGAPSPSTPGSDGGAIDDAAPDHATGLRGDGEVSDDGPARAMGDAASDAGVDGASAADGTITDGATVDGMIDGATRDGTTTDGPTLDATNPEGATADAANADGANLGETGADGSTLDGSPSGDGAVTSDSGTPPVCNTDAPVDYTGAAGMCATSATCNPDALGRRWSAPIRIDDGTACQTDALRASAQGTGAAIVAWDDVAPGRMRARRLAAGGTWSPIELAQPGSGAALSLGFGANGDALIAGIQAGNAFVATSTQSAPWSTSSLGSAISLQPGVLSAAMDPGGTGLTAWTKSGATYGFDVWTAASGHTALTNAATDALGVAVAPMPGGGLAVVALRISGIYFQLYSSTGTLSTGENVASFTSVDVGPRSTLNVTADAAGHVHVVWASPGLPNNPGTVTYRERLADGTWDYARSISNNADPSERPLVAASDDSSVLIVWAWGGAPDALHHFIMRTGSAVWQPALGIDAVDVVTYPAIAMDGAGNAILAWGHDPPDNGLVCARRYFAASGWESPQATQCTPIYEGPTAAATPFIDASVSPSGQGLVTYVVRQTGEQDQVYANTLR